MKLPLYRQVKVIRHARNVYACRHSERDDIQTKVVTAAMQILLIREAWHHRRVWLTS